MKVFVSSTCYDLIDLRAELRGDLRDLGAEAYFSDCKESDFVSSGEPSQNSIETCLENLRRCDVVVFILSQRYGPPLPGEYAPKSATHIEYAAAKASGKRIHFYVRDRLMAEYTL